MQRPPPMNILLLKSSFLRFPSLWDLNKPRHSPSYLPRYSLSEKTTILRIRNQTSVPLTVPPISYGPFPATRCDEHSPIVEPNHCGPSPQFQQNPKRTNINNCQYYKITDCHRKSADSKPVCRTTLPTSTGRDPVIITRGCKTRLPSTPIFESAWEGACGP